MTSSNWILVTRPSRTKMNIESRIAIAKHVATRKTTIENESPCYFTSRKCSNHTRLNSPWADLPSGAVHNNYNTVGCQEVGKLSLHDSESLLTKVIYVATSPSQSMPEAGKKIAEALGCLALAIVQAGAYIPETACALQDYLDIYERRKRSVLEYLPKHLSTDYQYSVYTTCQASIDAIELRKDAVSYHTLRLLCLLGFYKHDQRPIRMFYNAWHQSQASEIPDHLPWHDTISDFLE